MPRNARWPHPVRTLALALLAAVVGALSAYAALGFLVLIGLVERGMFGLAPPGAGIVLVPAAGGLLVGLLVRFAMPGQRGYGPADAIEAVQEAAGRMPLRAGLLSAAASVLSIGAGASVGRYGPAVHLGATLGSWFAQAVRLERAERIALLGAGVAAAIAAAFNAPLAGLLFAHEVVIRGFSIRAVMPIVVASAVGAGIARAHGSHVPIFALPDHGIDHVHEYPLFVLLGLAGAGLALAYMRSMTLAAEGAARLPGPAWLRPLAGGLIVGGLAVAFPQVLGLGEHAIGEGLAGHYALWLLLALIPAKLAATSVSLGFGFSGGVLGPALFLGTMLGMAFGVALGAWWPAGTSPAAVYGVAGMGAVASRVVGAPIATVLIVFELTASYTLTTGAMIAVVVASVVRSDRFPGSFFHTQLLERGVDPFVGREVAILRASPVGRLMRPARLAAGGDLPVARGIARLLGSPNEELFVIDDDERLLGIATLAELVRAERRHPPPRSVGEVAREVPLVLEAGTDLHAAMRATEGFTGFSVPVVDSRAGMRLLGVVRESDLLRAYGEAVHAARHDEIGHS